VRGVRGTVADAGAGRNRQAGDNVVSEVVVPLKSGAYEMGHVRVAENADTREVTLIVERQHAAPAYFPPIDWVVDAPVTLRFVPEDALRLSNLLRELAWKAAGIGEGT
jgi:hypothetical protein